MARTTTDLDETIVRTALQRTGLESEADLIRYALTALLERKESEDRYRSILEQIQEGYYEVDLTGSCTFSTAPLSVILGYSEAELRGMNYLRCMDKDNAAKVFRSYNEVFRTGISTKHVDWELIKKDGSRIYVETSVTLMRDISGKPVGFQGIVRDITLRKQMEEEIRRLSITDPLTGLYNRRGFLTLAEQHLKVSERIKRGSILLFADLDDLKIINDTWGHRKGDEALVEAAAIFREVFRESDVIARMGGDEFAILALETSLVPREAPGVLTDRLQQCISLHNARRDRDYTISMSIGVAFHDLSTSCLIDDLMSRADALMYEQKRRKREHQAGHRSDEGRSSTKKEEIL
jgi:diguanylate cyclase (GGDEF)-like protein/PAS domain S-box-containing protein